MKANTYYAHLQHAAVMRSLYAKKKALERATLSSSAAPRGSRVPAAPAPVTRCRRGQHPGFRFLRSRCDGSSC